MMPSCAAPRICSLRVGRACDMVFAHIARSATAVQGHALAAGPMAGANATNGSLYLWERAGVRVATRPTTPPGPVPVRYGSADMTQVRNPAEHHLTSTVRPPDFDAFWAEIMATAERIPLNPTIDPLAWRSTEAVDVFEIGYD